VKQTRKAPFFSKWNAEKNKFVSDGTETVEQQLLLKFRPEHSKDIDKYFDTNSYPIIDYNPTKKSWGFLNRYRAVLYFYYFLQNVKRFEFDGIYETGNILYQVRNENHRGSEPSEYVKKLLARTKGNECIYYLKFYGFLEDIVSNINSNLFKTKNPSQPDPKSKVNLKNTPFADIESLKNLKESL
jgi:hypothetical protein